MPKAWLTAVAFTSILSLASASAAGTSAAGRSQTTTIHADISAGAAVPYMTTTQFLNTQVGWLAGCMRPAAGGSLLRNTCFLLRTRDGGLHWAATQTGDLAVQTIDFRTPRSGWMVAVRAGRVVLLRSRNGGRTVQVAVRLFALPAGSASPTVPTLTSFGVNHSDLVVGSVMASTANDWKNWSLHAVPAGPAGSVTFRTVEHGFAVSGGAIYAIVDGGAVWHKVFSLPQAMLAWLHGTAPIPGGIAFASKHGYAAFGLPNCWAGGCPAAVAATSDSGAHWQLVSVGGPVPGWHGPDSGPGGGIVSVLAIAPHQILVSDMYGLQLSRDGGSQWQTIGAPADEPSGNFTSVAQAPDGSLYAVGSIEPGSFVLRLAKLGGRWQQIFPRPLPAQTLDFVTGRLGFALGLSWDPDALLNTTDGGRSWQVVGPLPSGTQLISFATARYGLAATLLHTPAVMRTTDGGRIFRPVAAVPAASIAAFSGARGTILEATAEGLPDGRAFRLSGRTLATVHGVHWPTTIPAPGSPFAIAYASPQRAWLLAFSHGKPRLFRTIDGGGTWSSVPLATALGPVHQLSDLVLSPFGTDGLWLGLVGGEAGPAGAEALVTSDAGLHWVRIELPNWTVPFVSGQWLSAVSQERAWLLTPLGLYRTSDGGRTWIPLRPRP